MMTSILSAQSFSGTWALTNVTTNTVSTSGTGSGTMSASAAAIGSGLTAPSYSATTGMAPEGWIFSDTGTTRSATEYIEYAVAPNSGYSMVVSSFTGEHSVTAGSWTVAAYYSLDNFSTETQIGSNITSLSSTTSTAFSFTGLSISVPETKTLKIRVFAWNGSLISSGSYRNKNVVMSGTTCPLPVISTQPVTQALCSGTALNLSVADTGGASYQWKKGGSNISGANAATYTIGSVTTSDAGNYSVDVTNSCGNGTATSSTAVVTVGVTATWNGTSWDNEPAATNSLVFNGNYSSASNLSGCSCTVNSGNVVINSTHTMTLSGAVNVAGGTLTFENNANLIQTTSAVNTGNVTVKRNSSALKRLDYTLWSSPVSSQNLLAFSPATLANRFYVFNSGTNSYNVIGSPSTTNFSDGKGYLIRMPNNHPTTPTVWNGTFAGVPNNGDVTVSLVDGGTADTRFNAVGNPYPSAIDISSFLSANSAAIDGTLWFWRKTNDDSNPISYSTCTNAGCVLNNDHTYADESSISTGQGFIVRAKSGATSLSFTNTMRSASTVDQFFKNLVGVNRFRLELTNMENVSFGQKMIAYLPETTLTYDDGYDGLFLSESNTRLTSKVDNRELAIQARSEFEATDIVPLYFETNQANTYTISLPSTEGVFADGQTIYVRDNTLQITHNLTQSAYSFATTAGAFANRFEILYQSQQLAVQNPTQNEATLFQSGTGELTVIANNDMETIAIYNLTGQLLYEQNNTAQATQMLLKNLPKNELLLVAVNYSDGTKNVVKSILR